MKYFIIAGEASGDLHASNLMKGLFAEDPEAEIRFWGGEKMAAVGGTLLHHYKEGAVMENLERLVNEVPYLNFERNLVNYLHLIPED